MGCTCPQNFDPQAAVQLDSSGRQELSYALYSQDAASRVIARLMRERDAARECVPFLRSLFAP